jgi:hypothetical protein
MLRPDGSSLHDSRGVVVAIHGGEHDSLRCELGHLAPDTGYIVYVGEDADAVVLGDVHTNGEGGALLVRETVSGAALTDHLGSLADIAGRHVEVRDLEGHVVLYGHVPGVDTPHDAEPVHTEGDAHDGTTGADVASTCTTSSRSRAIAAPCSVWPASMILNQRRTTSFGNRLSIAER